LKWDIEERVFQVSVVGHTGASGFVRLANQAIFKGRVESGLHYVLIDDFIAQGGTLANLRGHVLAQGCQVIGAG
jgi:adenine/guanine phosphoribosyltransferase-like PRPP-binding protein